MYKSFNEMVSGQNGGSELSVFNGTISMAPDEIVTRVNDIQIAVGTAKNFLRRAIQSGNASDMETALERLGDADEDVKAIQAAYHP